MPGPLDPQRGNVAAALDGLQVSSRMSPGLLSHALDGLQVSSALDGLQVSLDGLQVSSCMSHASSTPSPQHACLHHMISTCRLRLYPANGLDSTTWSRLHHMVSTRLSSAHGLDLPSPVVSSTWSWLHHIVSTRLSPAHGLDLPSPAFGLQVSSCMPSAHTRWHEMACVHHTRLSAVCFPAHTSVCSELGARRV